ncbi:alpha-amylase [Ursidibacter arcticus]
MQKSLLWLLLFTSVNLSANQWQSEHFPTFESNEKQHYRAYAELKKGNYPFKFSFNQQCFQPQTTLKLNQTISLVPCNDSAEFTRLFRDGKYHIEIDMRSGMPTAKLTVEATKSANELVQTCPKWDAKPLEIDVSSLFKDGEIVRDFYSGNTAKVQNGKVTMMPLANSGGLLLLEPLQVMSSDPIFRWKNATIYFVLTDRFYNGDTSNDNSYGRKKDGKDEIGTFHGGDLKGLTQKLDYLQQLGVNAIWISSPLEQIHGWVGGGEKGDFPHYAYHGYYHQDWTKIDANMGSEDDLKTFIDQAHQRGIRVIFDIVMNHTGYATLADMQQYGFGALHLKGDEIEKTLGKNWTDWTPKVGQSWHSFNKLINFSDKVAWQRWWGKAWIRSDIGDYDSPKFDDLKMSLASLPDIKTENEQVVELPEFFATKTDTQATFRENAKVRDYLIGWLSDWVEKYGVDGFRVDTAKHVEKSTWLALKQSAEKALEKWQKSNPKGSFGDKFWMAGESWGHGVHSSDYYMNGFDAMINFSFQDQAKDALGCFAKIAPTYQQMSEKLKDINVLSYISSHDTRLFFHEDSQNSLAKQKIAGSLLMLAPGAVQIYYGDESGRKFGATGSDPIQGTRSDMNWQDLEQNADNQTLVKHWQILAKFRQNHTAVGQGEQKTLEINKYFAFTRQNEQDKVMVVWAGNL